VFADVSKHLRMAGASRVAWTHQEAADAFALHAGRVERVAARILHDRDEARDVASETFLALLEGGPDDRQATESWLLTTARNRALNRLRERERADRAVRSLVASVPAVEPPVSVGDTGPNGLVEQAASLIGDRERVAVQLRFSEDRSYDEIATRLGISAGNARVLVHRALKRLRSGAVALLAERHGASERCRRALLRGASNGGVRTHHGCSPCTAVSDELAAMTASGMLPVALPAGGGFLARLLDAPLHALSRLHNPGSGRTAEALAALLVTGSVGLAAPASLPVHPPSVRAPVAAPRSDAVAAAARAGTAAVRRAGEAAPARPSAPAFVAPDAAGDNQPVPADLVPFGAPLVLRDAFEGSSAKGLDIRTLEIARLADEAGKTAGLLFRFKLDAPPRPQAEYRVDWNFGRPNCFGTILGTLPETFDGSEPSVHVDCAQPNQTPSMQPPPSPDSPIHMRIVGAAIEFTLVFSELEGMPAQVLHRGTVMQELRAATIDYQLAGMTSDTAPDYREPGVNYTI
jgi:RNA polymerase sigma-70 factor, ECF subfamily